MFFLVHVNFLTSRSLSRHISVKLCRCVIVKIVVAVCRAEGFPPSLLSAMQLKSPPSIFSSILEMYAKSEWK